MSDNYLDLFLPKRPVQGPPAPTKRDDSLDKVYKSLGVKGGVRQVAENNAKERKANETALGKERAGIESAKLSPEDDSLAKSIVFMSSKNDAGEELTPVAGVDSLGEFRPTVTYEDAIKMVRDPAQRKQWEDSRQLWRDQRAVHGNLQDPAYEKAQPERPGGLASAGHGPEAESAYRTAKFQRAWEESGGEPAKFLNHPDFSFQELRDELAHRTGAYVRDNMPLEDVRKQAGLQPMWTSEWAGNFAGQLIGGAALDFPASLEFSADPSKPVFDRIMAAGQAAMIVAGSSGSHGLVSGIEEAVKKVSAKSGLPEEAVAAAVKRAEGFRAKAAETVPAPETAHVPETPAVLKEEPQAPGKSSSSVIPNTLFHGTKSEFDGFGLSKHGTSDPGVVGKGVYFTPDEAQARNFAESPHYGEKGGTPRVIAAKVGLKNPAVIVEGVLPDGRTLTDVHPGGLTKESAAKINRDLKANGHDGVVFQDADGTVTQVVAFDPKSATPEPPQTGARRTVMDVQAEIDSVRASRDARLAAERKGPRSKQSGGVSVGPQDIKDAVTLGRLHFEKGLRSFDDWSREMISAFGTAIRSHLPDIWKQVSTPVEGDSVHRLQQALSEAKPLRSDFAAQLSEKARSEKAGKLAGAQSASVGKSMSEGMSRQMGSQKGSFANYGFELPAPIAPEDLAHLKDMVLTHPKLRPYEKLNAQLALEKIAGDGQYGGLPTDSEISALERVFGKGIGTQIRMKANEGFWESFWQEAMLHRKAGLLSGPRTILRNAIGNAVNAARTEVLRPSDALWDNVIRMVFPKATEGRRTIAWALAPSADRTRAVMQKTAVDVAEIMKHGQTWEGSAEVLRESRNPLVRYALRFQGVQDAVWMNAAYERSLAEQASMMVNQDKRLDFRTLMDQPTEAMEAHAQLDSQIATFNAPNKLAESIVSLTKIPVAGKIVDFLVPFKRVPSNIGSELAQANPLGLLYNWGKAFAEAKSTGKLSYATQKQLAKATTNGLLGSALLWTGVELARRGLLTGSAPVDPAQRTTNEALGVRPASLQVGDSRYQLTGTHPMLSVIALGASMYESAQKRNGSSDAQADRLKAKGLNPAEFGVKPQTGGIGVHDAGAWALALGSIMQEQPFLKGIKDAVDSMQSEHQLQTFVNSAAASFAPTIVPDIMRMVGKGDDVVRDASNPAEAWRARMGFGKDLPPKYDAFGKEVKIGGVFDVTNAKEVRTDPVSLLMKQNGLTVTKLQRLPSEPAAHFEERQKLYGRFLYHVVSQAEPQLSTVKDKKVLREVWNRLTDSVRSKLAGGLNTDVLRKVNAPPSTTVPTGG